MERRGREGVTHRNHKGSRTHGAEVHKGTPFAYPPREMAVLRRHRITEGLFGAGSMGALIAGAAAIDETFRGYLTGALAGEPSSALALASGRAQHVALRIMETVGHQGTEHASLALFALAAGALVLLMLRT